MFRMPVRAVWAEWRLLKAAQIHRPCEGVAMAGKQAQALAIKLSQQRRSGKKKVPPPPKGRYSERTRQKAKRDL
jgi:hypothetical protein